MRAFFRGFGRVLMFLAGILFLTALICSIPMARDLDLSLSAVLLLDLNMLLMCFGLFAMGRLLYEFNRRESADSSARKRQKAASSFPGRQSKPLASSAAPGSPVRHSPEASFPAKAPSHSPEEALLLYQNDHAREVASLDEAKSVPERLQLMRCGKRLVLQLQTVQLGELFSGSMYRVDQQEAELPESASDRLDKEHVISWAAQAYPCLSGLAWSDFPEQGELDGFCSRIPSSADCGEGFQTADADDRQLTE